MLLLHLSDIHFRKSEVTSPLDADLHLRDELLKDIVARCKKIGKLPSAILISGDIAFAGIAEEYAFALDWLENQLCKSLGVPLSVIFTCPGNHDISRKVADDPGIKSFHDTIKKAEPLTLDIVMKGMLESPIAGPLLFKSLEAYNQFAVRFICHLNPPDRTLAQRSLTMNDGSILVLNALNSTFVSSERDNTDKKLFVAPSFRSLLRQPGTINLAMCHHPYDWLVNGDTLKTHLDDVAVLQLFGHKHVERIERTTDCVRISAGSMQPERHEPGWKPGYNLIELDIQDDGQKRMLNVAVHVLVLQEGPTCFVPKKTKEQEEIFTHSIQLGSWEPPKVVGTETGKETKNNETAHNDPMSSMREIYIRFFRLNLSQRSAIAGKLNLLEEADADKSDVIRFQNALMRARERDLLKEVEAELKQYE